MSDPVSPIVLGKVYQHILDRRALYLSLLQIAVEGAVESIDEQMCRDFTAALNEAGVIDQDAIDVALEQFLEWATVRNVAAELLFREYVALNYPDV